MDLSLQQRRFLDGLSAQHEPVHIESEENGVFAVFKDNDLMAETVARFLITRLKENPGGLVTSTGSTPHQTYECMRAHLQAAGFGLLEDITTYAQDEYLGVHPTDPHAYIFETRFNLTGIFPLRNVLAPRGWWPDMEVDEESGRPVIPEAIREGWQRYDRHVIEDARYALFGIGPPDDPHIGFNRVGTDPESHIHVTRLPKATRIANARFFEDDPKKVPPYAVTLGIKTYLKMMQKADFAIALIMANTEEKAVSIQKTLSGDARSAPGAQLLQNEEARKKIIFTVPESIFAQVRAAR